MQMPIELKQLLSKTLLDVRTDPQHQIYGANRLAIYDLFGPSNYPHSRKESAEHSIKIKQGIFTLTNADKFFAKSCLICAQYLKPLWEQAKDSDNKYITLEQYINLYDEMLTMAQDILAGKIPLEEAWEALNNDFHYALRVGPLEDGTYLYKLLFVPYKTLSNILGGISDIDRALIIENPSKIGISVDVAAATMRVLAEIDDGGPLRNDTQKSLNYWEWWLTEAIPSAWSTTI